MDDGTSFPPMKWFLPAHKADSSRHGRAATNPATLPGQLAAALLRRQAVAPTCHFTRF